VLRRAAGRRDDAVALLFGLTALLSMWISNTTTTAMMRAASGRFVLSGPD